ncbi:MAG: DNA polymerase III subunit alpha [Desulfobacterales bacterium]|nr:DNA polymerase III subunit alpha [Desulfobacterales bacterium]
MGSKAYVDRLVAEVLLLKKKGFFPYFAIVKELTDWAKNQGIMIGPGRGSVGGSLIAYLLGITQVNPLEYGLLFERFISNDRIDFPDVDLDFEDFKVPLIREHLEKEYGQYNVVGISTFLRMKGRAVIRDVGRVFDLPIGDVDAFAKSIWAGEHDEEIVALAGRDTKEGQYFSQKYPEEFQLMTVLEGTIRGAGQHPEGLVISAKDLRNGENCTLTRRSESLVCNWDMDNIEYNGLVKMDLLKLATLTMLNEAKRLISLRGIKIDYEALPLNDLKIFQMLSEGDTAGIFQFSGYAQTEWTKKMGIISFEDMVAVSALARPGPAESGLTDLYIRRKKGEKWVPLHPIYEEITKDTYGVVVYQEQMMRAMTDLAGFSNSDADQIRKVIGKKRDPKEFEPYRKAFLEGCKKRKTLTQDQAQEFWKGLLEWASYGFNKSHAVEYAMIGYWTAFLKLYYPIEFFCAQLTYGSDKGSIIKEVERVGMRVVTPKVGVSDARRWIVKGGQLYMPFIEIKGIGETQAGKCASMRSAPDSSRGFFRLDRVSMEAKGKLEKLLVEVCAFDPDPSARPKNCLDYFQYPISEEEDTREEIVILKRRGSLNFEAKNCDVCGLKSQACQAVLSSLGVYNVLALGESPGRDEDHDGVGFVGDASKLLWSELSSYGITRRMLHIGNCCKCWPSRTKTPSKKEIDECFARWMAPEIRSMDCRLILAMGNIPLYALTGKDSGITALSGQLEWVNKVRSWVVWCVHPAAVLRSRSSNIDAFKKGIEVFAETFKKGIE